MQRLVEASLAHRLVVILLALLLMGAGWVAFKGLPIDAFPDVIGAISKIAAARL